MDEKQRLQELAGIDVGKGTDFVNKITKLANAAQKKFNDLDHAASDVLKRELAAATDKTEKKNLSKWQKNVDDAYDALERALDDFVEAAIG